MPAKVRVRSAPALVLAALVVAAANACSASDANGASGARSPCSTGPAYVDAAQFAVAAEDPGSYPQCLAPCGEPPAAGAGSIAAVPSGACAVEGERCSTGVAYFCGSGQNLFLGREDDMRCDCTHGRWSCVITAQGGGTCGTPLIDGGGYDGQDARADSMP